ncbi:MAG: orotidine-5'-phosphate decarboxylase, partial [Patescibacteria group bacterium]
MLLFQEKLDKVIEKNNSLLCVGLDPKTADSFSFNRTIIDQTHDLVCAYKPNSAFYEAYGAQGIEELKKTCEYIQKNYPEIPIILDAKRGDIGNTNEGYAKFTFEYLKVDAITLHPYLGSEAIRPFLEYKDKGLIILCRTSNQGAGELQDLKVDGVTLYRYIATRVKDSWNKNNNCLLVVGATYPKELKELRDLMGEMTFLVPGIGAQGGNVEETVKAGLNSDKKGMIINSSRGIIFADNPRQ